VHKAIGRMAIWTQRLLQLLAVNLTRTPDTSAENACTAVSVLSSRQFATHRLLAWPERAGSAIVSYHAVI
jgi:hypothetical protein